MSISLKKFGLTLAALALLGGMTACGGSTTNEKTSASPAASSAMSSTEPTSGNDAGFREGDLGDEVFVGPLVVAGKFFQPVPMTGGGLDVANSSMHVEADIAAIENNGYGWGAGDFVPGLTVDYKFTGEDGSVAAEGQLMPMNASDGPHYGLNVPKLPAGVYKVEFTIHAPEGWMLHTDPETGVEKHEFWTEPLVATFEGFQWDPETTPWW